LLEYALYFIITLTASTIFAIIGVGSSLVLIPLFTLMGIDFTFAKAIGLFANGTTTLFASINNIRHQLLDFTKVVPYLILSIVFAVLGALSSNYISESIVKVLLVLFIFFSLYFMYIGQNQTHEQYRYTNIKAYLFVSIIAFVGGLIGVGGGMVYLPLFLYFGFKAKESIAITTTLIPFVSFSAFFTYASFVEFDWILLALVGVGAVLGGYFGSNIMHRINNDKLLKVLISMFLLFLAVDMLYINFRELL